MDYTFAQSQADALLRNPGLPRRNPIDWGGPLPPFNPGGGGSPWDIPTYPEQPPMPPSSRPGMPIGGYPIGVTPPRPSVPRPIAGMAPAFNPGSLDPSKITSFMRPLPPSNARKLKPGIPGRGERGDMNRPITNEGRPVY